MEISFKLSRNSFEFLPSVMLWDMYPFMGIDFGLFIFCLSVVWRRDGQQDPPAI